MRNGATPRRVNPYTPAMLGSARLEDARIHLRTSLRVIQAVLRNPALRRVELAFLLFNAAEFGAWVAILLYAYEATGPAAIGLVAAAQLIPAALVAPFAALIADHPDRARSLAVGYGVQAVAYGATAAGIVFGAPPIIVYLAAAVAAATLVVTRPTQGALLPELSRTPEELSAANGLSGTAEGGGVFLGPLAAAAILTVGGPGQVFAAATAAVGVAALLVLSVTRRVLLDGQASEPSMSDGQRLDGAAGMARRSILDGLRVVRQNRHVRLVVGILGLRAVASGAMDVLFVLLALEVFHSGESGAGILNGALGIGSVLGGAVSFLLVGRRRLAPALAFAACVLGGALIATALVGSGSDAPIIIAVGGIGYGACAVAGLTILQRTTPDAVLGRVLGSLESVHLVGLALGSLLVPVVVSVIGVQGALAVAGALLPLAVLFGWGGLRDIDRGTRIPARELALLVRVRAFAPLPSPQLESLARHVRWLAVDPGTSVIIEGEPGDAFYVVERGRFRVDQGGVTLRTLEERADGFGEIALIRNVPRTATVTAEVPSVLLVVGRDAFLGALAGHAPTRAALDVLVEERS